MVLSIIIFVAVYVLIAFELVDKTAAALAGAVAVILLGLVPYEEAKAAIDMNVLFLLMGMMIVMSILSETGMFEWLAIAIAQKAKGNARLIVLCFLLVTAVLSAVLDNVTTVILVAPVTILITQLLEVKTAPILILMAIFSNIGGTATLIGDPPNILIGSGAGLEFMEFIEHLTPIILLITMVCLVVVNFQLGRKTNSSPLVRDRVMLADARLAILDTKLLRTSLFVLGVILLGFFTGRLTHFEPGIVAMGGAVLMIVLCKVDLHDALHRVEWATILFFIGLFMLISALEHNHLFTMAGEHLVRLTQGNLLMTAITILWAAAILSAIVDNIPLVIAMIPLIASIIPTFATQMGAQIGHELTPEEVKILIAEPLYWSLALGACLGGNGTLIGASANVVIAQIGNRNKCEISFMQFTREGFPIMLLTVAISTVYIYGRYFYLRDF